MKQGRQDSVLPKILKHSESIDYFLNNFYFPENCNLTTASNILNVKKATLWLWMKRNNIKTKGQSESQSGVLNAFKGREHSQSARAIIGKASKARQPVLKRGKHGRYSDDGKHPFGPGNPTWTTGNSYHFYKRFIVEHGPKCDHCDAVFKKLHIHHKDRIRENNDPSNLEVLCITCHHKNHIKSRDKNGRFAPSE